MLGRSFVQYVSLEADASYLPFIVSNCGGTIILFELQVPTTLPRSSIVLFYPVQLDLLINTSIIVDHNPD